MCIMYAQLAVHYGECVMYVCVYLSMYVCIHVYVCMHVYVSVCVCMCVYVCICVLDHNKPCHRKSGMKTKSLN